MEDETSDKTPLDKSSILMLPLKVLLPVWAIAAYKLSTSIKIVHIEEYTRAAYTPL